MTIQQGCQQTINHIPTFSFRLDEMLKSSKKRGINSKINIAAKRQQEIVEFSKELQKYNLSFSLITSHHFKNGKEKDTVTAMIKFIIQTPSAKEKLLNAKIFPKEEIQEHFQVSEKFIRKHKLYIIAMSLLLIGSYDELRDYLSGGLF